MSAAPVSAAERKAAPPPPPPAKPPAANSNVASGGATPAPAPGEGGPAFSTQLRTASGTPAPPSPTGGASVETTSGTTGAGTQPSGADATASPTGIVGETARGGGILTDPAGEIAQLNSDGDQVVMSVTAEGKLQVPTPWGVGLGGKTQYGYDITVAQVGGAPSTAPAPGAPAIGARPAPATPPAYEVTFDKNLLAGVTAEPMVPGADPAVELNFRTADSVTMRFDNQADASRAVQVLHRVAAAETIRDGGQLASPGLSNPGSNPLAGDGSESLPGGDLPVPGMPGIGNIPGVGSVPGAVSDVVADRIGPSETDMQFLRDNTVSFSQRIGVQERAKVAVKFANLGIEPRLDGNVDITRTVQLPRDGEPGRLSYTLSGELQASSKEKLTLGKQSFDQLEVGYSPQNIVDHGIARGEATIAWDLPPGAAFSTVSGRPVPEADLIGAGRLDNPDQVSARISLEHQDQSLIDLSRTDQRRFSLEVSTRNPRDHAAPVVNDLLGGDLAGAFRQMGDDFTITAEADRVARNGVNQQHEIGAEIADVAEAKVSLIANIGRDDVYAQRTRTLTGTEIADRLDPDIPTGTVDPTLPPGQPVAPGDQMVVVPRDGLNVRAEPALDGREISAFQNGTFVDPTGASRRDQDGRDWVEVRGLDQGDRQVQGWVASEHLRPHPQGAMDGQGRINPELEAQGYSSHRVQAGENLWDIARRDGVNFGEMVALNGDHVIDPSMIFPGDKVYLPNSGRPPAVPAEPPASPQATPAVRGEQPSAPSRPDASTPSAPSTPTAPSPPAPSRPPVGPSSETPSAPSTPSEPSGPPARSAPSPSVPGTPPTEAPAGPQEAAPPAPPTGPVRPDLGRILADYQVPDDEITTFRPDVFGIPVPGFIADPVEVTQKEADLLDGLSVSELSSMQDIRSSAEQEASRQFPPPQERRADFPPGEQGDRDFRTWALNDGQNDAFRHSYWNALMAQRFGGEFARDFATAHEGAPGNPADREAMDLYNNRIGRDVAAAHPDASEEELAGHIRTAIDEGRMIVIDSQGNLAWSDGVPYGRHGRADDAPGGDGNLPAPGAGGPDQSDPDPTDSTG